MIAFLRWYLVVQGLGWIAFLLARPVFCHLPDRGYAFAKILGVLLAGVALWLGVAWRVLDNHLGGAVLAVLLLGLAAWSTRRWRDGTAPLSAGPVVGVELVFLIAFAGWCVVRAFDPAVNHTEQPMDLMLLTATSISGQFPPQDPWLAGYPVGYYYLGYWLMSTLGHLALLPPAIGYNVGQACWFGLLCAGSFGLGYNLAALSAGPGARRLPLLAGLLTTLAVCWTGNLRFVLDRIGGDGGAGDPNAHWWWWRSSRALLDTDLAGRPIELITEFPLFSYILGDNHPHVLSMPFVLLGVALALGLLLHATHRLPAAGPAPAAPGVRLGLVLLVVVSGALLGINTWDYPALLLVCALAAGIAFAGGGDAPALRRTVIVTAGLGVAGALVYAPYLLTAQSQVRGLLPNLFHPTPLGSWVVLFGPFVPGTVLTLFVAGRDGVAGWSRLPLIWLALMGSAAVWLLAGFTWATSSAAGRTWIERIASGVDGERLWALALQRWARDGSLLLFAVALLAIALTLLAGRRRMEGTGAAATTFVLVLTCAGLALVLLPELVYVHDLFGNRMNTVFKLHYVAWPLLGTSAAFGIAEGWRRGRATRVAAGLALIVLAVGWLYGPAAIRAKTDGFTAAPTLDALAHLAVESPGELATIRWVREHTPSGAVVVQAEGRSYQPAEARVSAATGRPTLLGWEGHERQWRGDEYPRMAAGRAAVLQGIYNPVDPAALARDLTRSNVSWVVVGPVERARYAMSNEHERQIAALLPLVLEDGGFRLYGWAP